MIIIGFTGKMGVGKSTAIERIKRLNHKTFNIKFAGPLYQIQEHVYNTIAPVYQRPASFVKDRKLLQWIGTEFGRSLSETLWVDLWKDQVRKYMQEFINPVILCDDVRFDNEAEAVRSLGGVVVEIISDKNKERIDTTSGLVHHKSEAGIDSKLVDYTVTNNGSVQEFELAIRNVFGLISTKERNN